MEACAPVAYNKVAYEEEVARKLRLVRTFRLAVFPSCLLSSNSELEFRASSRITKLAYRLRLEDNVKKLAEAGNTVAIEFLKTEQR